MGFWKSGYFSDRFRRWGTLPGLVSSSSFELSQKEEILSFEEIEKFSESDLVVHEGQGAVSKKRILDLGRFSEETFRIFFPREVEVLPGGTLRVDSHVCGH
jgi:hypothetical protein